MGKLCEQYQKDLNKTNHDWKLLFFFVIFVPLYSMLQRQLVIFKNI